MNATTLPALSGIAPELATETSTASLSTICTVASVLSIVIADEALASTTRKSSPDSLTVSSRIWTCATRAPVSEGSHTKVPLTPVKSDPSRALPLTVS